MLTDLLLPALVALIALQAVSLALARLLGRRLAPEAIGAGWYGAVSPGVADRIGDVVAICRDDWVVLATGLEPAPIARMVAFHGSYTAAEMEIPLLVVRGG